MSNESYEDLRQAVISREIKIDADRAAKLTSQLIQMQQNQLNEMRKENNQIAEERDKLDAMCHFLYSVLAVTIGRRDSHQVNILQRDIQQCEKRCKIVINNTTNMAGDALVELRVLPKNK